MRFNNFVYSIKILINFIQFHFYTNNIVGTILFIHCIKLFIIYSTAF